MHSHLMHSLCIHTGYKDQRGKTAMGINYTLKTTPSGLRQGGIFALVNKPRLKHTPECWTEIFCFASVFAWLQPVLTKVYGRLCSPLRRWQHRAATTPNRQLGHELFRAQPTDRRAVTTGCSVKSQTARGNGRKWKMCKNGRNVWLCESD